MFALVLQNNSKLIECPKCPGDTKAGREDSVDTELTCKEFDGQRRCWSNKKCQKSKSFICRQYNGKIFYTNFLPDSLP